MKRLRGLNRAILAIWLATGAAAATGVSADVPRDPFSLPPTTLEDGRTIYPLQRYRLEELSLVATAHGGGSPRALIEDPTGLGFVVRVGQIVGVEAATVAAIEEGRVLLDLKGISAAAIGNPLSTAARAARRAER